LEVVASDVLPENDVRVAELKTIVESEVVEMGTPLFDMVSFVEYSTPGATALILPLVTEGETRSSCLISYFVNGEYKNSIFIEFTPTQEYIEKVVEDRSIDYSGEFAIYTKSGEAVVKNVLSEGTIIETYENTELRSEFTECLRGCMRWYIDQLPFEIRWLCNSSLIPCISLGPGILINPSSAIIGAPACAILYGCIGGGFFNCINWCSNG